MNYNTNHINAEIIIESSNCKKKEVIMEHAIKFDLLQKDIFRKVPDASSHVGKDASTRYDLPLCNWLKKNFLRSMRTVFSIRISFSQTNAT